MVRVFLCTYFSAVLRRIYSHVPLHSIWLVFGLSVRHLLLSWFDYWLGASFFDDRPLTPMPTGTSPNYFWLRVMFPWRFGGSWGFFYHEPRQFSGLGGVGGGCGGRCIGHWLTL